MRGTLPVLPLYACVLQPSEKKHLIKEYMFELHKERQSLIAHWKSEFEQDRQQNASALPFETVKKHFLQPCIESIAGMVSYTEVFISNLPLTIGAVALAWGKKKVKRLLHIT